MKLLKRIVVFIVLLAGLNIISVNAIEPMAVIEYNTTETKKTFTGELGYAKFYSVMRYNTKTYECALTDHYSRGYPKSGYTFSTNNGGKGTVTYKDGNIVVTWNWTLKDAKGLTVQSGTEKHVH